MKKYVKPSFEYVQLIQRERLANKPSQGANAGVCKDNDITPNAYQGITQKSLDPLSRK